MVKVFRSMLRNLARDRNYMFLNVFGLAIALACSTVLGLYLYSEYTYDRHHLNHSSIFRLVAPLPLEGAEGDRAMAPQPLGPLFAQDYPEVSSFVRFKNLELGYSLQYQEQIFFWDSLMYADPNVFEVFTHEFIAGDPVTALLQPNSITISRSLAEAYFGDISSELQAGNILGRSLSTIDGDFQITGVFADLPDNTHLKYDALLTYQNAPIDESFDSLIGLKEGVSDFTYLVMPENYPTENFDSISESFNERYISPLANNTDFEINYYLEPLADIHLNSTTIEDRPRGNRAFLLILMALGSLVALLACINYVNLSTARVAEREKEIDLRKILGAKRRQLIFQFLGESLCFSLVALPLSLLIISSIMTLPALQELLDVEYFQQMLRSPEVLGLLLLGTLALGVFAGAYPAIYLSSQSSFKSEGKTNPAKLLSIESLVRQGLVFFQFVFSIAVIASSILMFTQLRFIQNNSLTFDIDNTMVVNLRYDAVRDNLQLLTDLLVGNPAINSFTASRDIPGGRQRISRSSTSDGRSFPVIIRSVGPNYLEVMGLELIAGTDIDFDQAMTQDTRRILVNEAFLGEAGWSKEEALGRFYNSGLIVGVVRDFVDNPRSPILPLQIVPEIYNGYRYLFVNISDENVQETIRFMQATWLQVNPAFQFEYQFFDDYLGGLFVSEQRQMFMVGASAVLCILLSCLGLAGLAAFGISRRKKELGIRKVLGASGLQLLILLFKRIFYTIVFAAPVAAIVYYLSIIGWLRNFSFQTEVNFIAFSLATVICLSLAIIVVTIQSWKSTVTNPVEALRFE